MTIALTLINDHATRVVAYTIGASADVSVPHLPSRIAPLAVTGVRLTYTSRRGSAWTLESVRCLGNHAPNGEEGRAFRSQQDHYPEHTRSGRPAWLNALMDTAADPDAPLPHYLAGFTRTQDSARRFIAFEISGESEIPQWHPLNMPTASPLRPDRVRLSYLAEENMWRLDAAEFEGPWVATGQQAGPDQNRGSKPYYPTSSGGSLRGAPSWVLDLLGRHTLPPELAAM
ncbi:hypothetical protein AB0393_28025 [Streptomyces cyaneofuscatus]|uniref:hypothetical protein n=1 Tax=Streptomyces cyaneofuscatus TaxID=66883 RepID=UPI00344DABB4